MITLCNTQISKYSYLPSVSTPLTIEPTLEDVKETQRPVAGAVKFPALQAALKSHYGAQGTLQLSLSRQRFLIKDVSLTISDKSEQDQGVKACQLAAEAKAKEKKEDEKEAKDSKKDKDVFWSLRFRLEEEWHRIDKSIAVQDVFTIKASTKPTQRIVRC